MRGFDRGLFVLALVLGAFDGADLASMGLALSRISRELSLSPSQAGWCASASLVGLMSGAIVGGRLGDWYGRRSVLSVATAFLGIFSTATTFAHGYYALLVVRGLAGLGMGGLFPVLIAACHDGAAARYRATAVGLLTASSSVGAIALGFVAMVADWRWVFYVGGLGPLLVLPYILWAPRASDPASPTSKATHASIRSALFGQGRGYGTVCVWVICFCTSLAVYCMLNWLPAVLVRQGFTENQSHLGSVLFSLGGLCGTPAAGRLVDRGLASQTYATGYGGAALALLGLGLMPTSVWVYAVVFLMAFLTLGAQLVTFSLTPGFYPDAVRNTGVGAMVTSGRLGSITGPLIAGQLLHSGLSVRWVFIALAPGLLLACVFALLFLGARRRVEVDGLCL